MPCFFFPYFSQSSLFIRSKGNLITLLMGLGRPFSSFHYLNNFTVYTIIQVTSAILSTPDASVLLLFHIFTNIIIKNLSSRTIDHIILAIVIISIMMLMLTRYNLSILKWTRNDSRHVLCIKRFPFQSQHSNWNNEDRA